jgi:hypothetical protein
MIARTRPPPLTPKRAAGGTQLPPTTTTSPGWSGEGPGGGDSTAPPGQPTDRPLSELLAIAAEAVVVKHQHSHKAAQWRLDLAAELRDTAAQFEALELSDH